ncbi:enolase 3 [Homo sapiens]|uniref:Enolase 3 n=1 Tax=Homo sapiens TaxID=9606 RepID=E5RJH5_HUMAN|nr:enolase 3 [Homo sapiens]KAI4047290.1 enolase 3 [Homo sapiens]
MAMQKIFAREILDSRGNPTVEVDLHTAKDFFPSPLLPTWNQSWKLGEAGVSLCTASCP